MKANELRIGNYYKYYNGCKDAYEYKQFSHVDFYHTYNNEKALLDFEPIKLNEEWLIKCGFIKDEELAYRWYLYEYSLVYDLDDNCIRISDSWEYNKIKYAHQLQNLYFALTGKELKL